MIQQKDNESEIGKGNAGTKTKRYEVAGYIREAIIVFVWVKSGEMERKRARSRSLQCSGFCMLYR